MVMLTLCLALLQQAPQDERFVEIVDLPQPDGVVLEVGGILPRGDQLLVSTRRGEVWQIDEAYGDAPRFTLFAEGLQEPLGLLEQDGWILVAQRGELSRMRDVDGDGRMDELETVAGGWPLSGNYHEYCFGPARAGDGSLWLTLNKPFGDEPFGRADWRGWALRIGAGGGFEGVVAGLRSPAGVEAAPWGEIFYSDNQGEWCATSKFAPLHEGEFHGHPHGIDSCRLPASRVEHPGEVPSGLRIDAAAARIPHYTLPAVWIPYDRLGRSPSGFVWDRAGHFPPYKGHVFMGDQYSSEVMRLTLEKVQGRWQGACYPFRRGLKCGITRVAWGQDGSLWAGMTNRGWPSIGPAKHGLQRLRWKGETPLDLAEVRVLDDGFRLRFTKALDPESVAAASFAVRNWTYDHHASYGCPERDPRELEVRAATLSEDRTTVDLRVEGLVLTRVHMIEAPGVRGPGGEQPWHAVAWYTLNAMP
jgi:hypothetical protein